MTIPLVDLKAQYNAIKTDIDEAMCGVVERGVFIIGSEVKAFEAEIADYLGAKHAVGVASGTDALVLALLACGIGPGDEVITTPFTFIATAEAVSRCGATPVFVDIDPETYNINPQKIEELLEQRSQSQSKSHIAAILPVHLYGQTADMGPILDLAKKYNLKVIEDCAQSLGAIYNGALPQSQSQSIFQSPVTSHSKMGTLGNAGCFSFFPSKMLGAYGDGGMVVTDSDDIAEKVRMLRNHGAHDKYRTVLHGFNSRLDELQAAILRVKLRHLDSWIELRRQKADMLSGLLEQVPGIQPPYIASYSYHVFNYYTIRLNFQSQPQSQSQSKYQSPITNHRSRLQSYLASCGIATAVYYPLSLHLQEVYRSLGYKPGDFPESEQAQEQVISLPMYPELSEEQIKEISGAIGEWARGQ